MSILQLALKDRVYILDIKVLYTTHGAEDALKTFFFQFFTKRTVTKIGKMAYSFGFRLSILGAFQEGIKCWVKSRVVTEVQLFAVFSNI